MAGRDGADVRGIGIGVPAPVAFSRGEPVAPPMMPGWDGFSIPGWFARYYDVPVLVDNDVNIMALGEHWTHWREFEHMLYVKMGTGIGCGLVTDRRIHRGAQGAAGDIGHIRLAGHDNVLCRCGNVGCLEAVAGGRALAARLTARGAPAASSRDVVRLVRDGEPLAIQAVRDAGRHLGEVLAECINFFNPGAIVIGGDLAEAHQQLLAGRARGRVRALAADGDARAADGLLAARGPGGRDRRRDHGDRARAGSGHGRSGDPGVRPRARGEVRRADLRHGDYFAIGVKHRRFVGSSAELSANTPTKPAASSALLLTMADCLTSRNS